MSDSFTQTSSTSWFGRIKESIKGVLVGLLLFVVSFPVLWLNEKNSAETTAGLKELLREAVTVEASLVNPQFEGKPVHLNGQAETDEVLHDPRFGVAAKAIKLIREVEMYQWKENETTETRRRLTGGEKRVTTYSYEKVWETHQINSRNFNQQGRAGHENPPMPYQSQTVQAKAVSLGAFKLSPSLVGQMHESEVLDLNTGQRDKLPADLRAKLKDEGPGYYQGSPDDPQIGDLRIKFLIVPPATVSIVARQTGSTFERYLAKNKKGFELLEMGQRTKENVIQVAQDRNKKWTWILRLLGLLLMFLGLALFLQPLAVLADVVPLLGDVVEVGTWLISAIVAVSFSLMTIGVAWIRYRPVIGIPLALLSTVLCVLVVIQLRRQRPSRVGGSSHVPLVRQPSATYSLSRDPLPVTPQPLNQIKFACPGCGQHIECDAAYGGREINCPTCAAKMLVPM